MFYISYNLTHILPSSAFLVTAILYTSTRSKVKLLSQLNSPRYLMWC